MGVAIPHTKSLEFNDFFIAIGIHKNSSVNWFSIDKNPVKIVFLIAGPENKQSEYLHILSKLTSIIKNENFRKKLLKIDSKEKVLKLFDQI